MQNSLWKFRRYNKSSQLTWIIFHGSDHNFLVSPNWLTHLYTKTYMFLRYFWLLNMPRQVTTMMMLGKGARCWVYLSFLRPSKTIDDQFPNQYPKQRLDNLVAVCQGVHTRAGRSFQAIWFTSETFPGAELLAAK